MTGPSVEALHVEAVWALLQRASTVMYEALCREVFALVDDDVIGVHVPLAGAGTVEVERWKGTDAWMDPAPDPVATWARQRWPQLVASAPHLLDHQPDSIGLFRDDIDHRSHREHIVVGVLRDPGDYGATVMRLREVPASHPPPVGDEALPDDELDMSLAPIPCGDCAATRGGTYYLALRADGQVGCTKCETPHALLLDAVVDVRGRPRREVDW